MLPISTKPISRRIASTSAIVSRCKSTSASKKRSSGKKAASFRSKGPVQSAPPPPPPSSFPVLPPESRKNSDGTLRSLISLYHSTSSFITSSDSTKLQSAIDDRILSPSIQRPSPLPLNALLSTAMRKEKEALLSTEPTSFSTSQLDIFSYDGSGATPVGGAGVLDNNVRTRMIFDALHGTSMGGKAGLETVREKRGELEGIEEELRKGGTRVPGVTKEEERIEDEDEGLRWDPRSL